MEVITVEGNPTFSVYTQRGWRFLGNYLSLDMAVKQGQYWDGILEGKKSDWNGIRGIILFSGKARTGKNTFAEDVEKELKETYSCRVLSIAFADFLKTICRDHYGFTGEKKGEGRSILQKVGDVYRKNYLDIFVDIVKANIYASFGLYDYILITDLRFLNEVGKIKACFGNIVHTVRVERPKLETDLTEEQQNHPSETEMDMYRFDDVVVNDSTEETLREKAKKYVAKIYEHPLTEE